eukprot:6352687-Amphidinium_carterae.1
MHEKLAWADRENGVRKQNYRERVGMIKLTDHSVIESDSVFNITYKRLSNSESSDTNSSTRADQSSSVTDRDDLLEELKTQLPLVKVERDGQRDGQTTLLRTKLESVRIQRSGMGN